MGVTFERLESEVLNVDVRVALQLLQTRLHLLLQYSAVVVVVVKVYNGSSRNA